MPVGPGRGSGAGSLVAYSLGITDLDPLRYDLLFERFLNPERVSMPDFDIDFCQDGRDRVIDYVQAEVRRATRCRRSPPSARWRRRRWCATSAACSTCGYNVLRRHRQADPVPAGQAITLQDAREMEPQLNEREKNEEEVARAARARRDRSKA